MPAKVSGMGIIAAGGFSTKEALFDLCLHSKTLPLENGLIKIPENDFKLLVQSLPSHLLDLKSRCGVLSALAFQAAIADAGWSLSEVSAAGFIFSSTTSQIDLWEKTLPQYSKIDSNSAAIETSSSHQSLATPANLLAAKFNIKGPVLHMATSCSASLQAIAIAALWIKNKKLTRCIVGSTEIHSQLTEVGFSSLRLLSKSAATPFDQSRKGINLGEASAFLCLEASDLRNDEKNWGYVRGCGLTTDAYHPTAPHPEGKGSALALRQALCESRIRPHEIDWIYSHGTGSIANDFSEAVAIENVFSNQTPVTSTKPIHGHTLAASGALESVLGLMAMKKNLVLATPGLMQKDKNIHINIADKTLEKEIQFFIKNSLGFGGINASVVYSKQKGS